MSSLEEKLGIDQPARYIIEVQGRLAQDWTDHFSGMDLAVIASPTGITITRLTGVLPDQPALHGLLQNIRDFNLVLVRVECIAAADEMER